eukprot:5311069-Prymnesium_polylepis.2
MARTQNRVHARRVRCLKAQIHVVQYAGTKDDKVEFLLGAVGCFVSFLNPTQKGLLTTRTH